MRAAILCPGPSLKRGLWSDHEGLTVCVNRASAFTACDVWAAGDQFMLVEQRPDVIGSPALLTAASTAAYLRDHGRPWPRQTIEFEDLYGYLNPHDLSWTMYTMTAAIVYAASVGSQHIDVYGCDWNGIEDYDGWKEAGNRSDERWTLERQIFARLTDALAGRGVEVRRVNPDR